MVTIVNYGLGNVQAFVNIYKRLNIPVAVADTTDDLAQAERIILPGVGAFDWAMTLLNESGMRNCLDDMVVVKKCPVLGVCVGMQMMARRSDEGVLEGLGWIDGEVRIFKKDSEELGVRSEEREVRSEELGVRSKERGGRRGVSLPHMGWNDVSPQRTDCLFKEMDTAPRFYFLHSYYFLPEKDDEVLATTDYNGPFASAVRSGNMFGTQFHPEKSHQWGIRLLQNFAEI